MTKAPTLDEVLGQVRKLSPVDKVRLIEQVAPEIERELTGSPAERRSLLGSLKDLGTAPSFEEIDEARREAWGGFRRTVTP